MAVKKHELMPENNLGLLAHYLDISKAYSPSDLINLSKLIVMFLSKVKIPNDATDRSLFYIQIQQVEDYLKKIVINIEPNSKLKLLFGLLKQLYGIISSTGPTTCPAASIILNLSPITNVHRYVNVLVSNEDSGSTTSSVNEKDNKLRMALSTLCHWLCYWEGTPVLHEYIISFMKALQELNKFEILMDVSMEVICELFNALQYPPVRITVINVFLHILSSTRDSIDTFDKIAFSVPTVLENLASDTSSDSRSVLQNLVEAFTALLDLHPTHKTNYTEIVNYLDAHIKSNNCYITTLPMWKKNKSSNMSKKKSRKAGLLNLGNTCYMNSALQALLMTKQFSNSILLSELHSPILFSMKSLFARMLFSNIPCVNPQEILLKSKPSYFMIGAQQDSSEFICHLLDQLHEIECSNRSKNEDELPFNSVNFQSDSSTALDMSSKAVVSSCDPLSEDGSRKRRKIDSPSPVEPKRRCLKNNDENFSYQSSSLPKTIVQEVFAGAMTTSTRCLKCNSVSSKHDAFWDLQLAFPGSKEKADSFSISQLLEYYCSPERLVENNQYHCQNCKSLQDAERSVSIKNAPKNLIVVLKQFDYDSKQRVRAKLFHDVILEKNITIFEGCVKNFYEMYAVIVHTGPNLDTGHYYTIARDTPNNWYVFDDSEVRRCTEQSLYKIHGVCTPYIIFYKKLGSSHDDSLPGTSSSKSKSEESSEDIETSSSSITFNKEEESLPFSLLPAYLVEQIKNTDENSIPIIITRRSLRSHKRQVYDDDQPGSSSSQ